MTNPGDDRCPGLSTQDIITTDMHPAGAPLDQVSYRFLGDKDIPFERHTSSEFFNREVERMWPRVWQWACREEQLPNAGDYYVYDVARYSIVVVRTDDGEVKGYYNSCPHRGTQLKPSGSSGNTRQIRCPFHGFTWDIQGRLVNIPCRWDFPHIKDEEFTLPEVKVEVWGGFVFINLDDDAVPLKDYLGVLSEHFSGRWDLTNRYVELHVEKILPANWKTAQEAFIEAYHVLATHPQAIRIAGDANTQYDLFGQHVNRFVQTLGFPSPHLNKEFTEEEMLGFLAGGDTALTVGKNEKARGVYAEHLRVVLGKQYQVDLSEYTDSEMIDSIEYHLFPNMFLFPGISLPMIYRFRPNGMDVDSCIFDLLFLRPNPDGRPSPKPAEPFKLGVADSFKTVPGFNPGLARVYDQDTALLEMQRKGLASSYKSGATLGNYQEVRIRHVHQTLDEYLAD